MWTPSTRNPSSPRSTSAGPVPSLIVRGLPSSRPSRSGDDGQAPGPRGGSPATPEPPLQRETPDSCCRLSQVPRRYDPGVIARRVRSEALAVLDLATSSLLAGAVGAATILRRFGPRSDRGGPAKLLALEGTYSLETVLARKIEHAITGRDLEGFFDHVWSVHPAVGASPAHSARYAAGPPSSVSINSRHTVIEGNVALFRRLRWLPRTNFLAAQAVLISRLCRLIRHENVSIIWSGDPYYLGLLGFVLASATRLPVVVSVYGNFDAMYEATGSVAYPRLIPWRWLEKRVERWVLGQADLVVAGNEDNLQFALRNGATEDRATVFRPAHWIHPDHFDVEPEDRRTSGRELGLGTRPYMILIGRLIPLKHPEDVLDVLSRLRRCGRDIVAVFVGEGAMLQELERMAAEMGISGDVVFAGNRDQPWIAKALSSAAVVLSPYTGLALIEACLSGTAVVAYDVEWQAELVSSGETGLLVPYRDTASMAEAVCSLLDDPAYAAVLGRQARKRAREMMDRKRLLEHQRSSYASVLSEPGHRRTRARR